MKYFASKAAADNSYRAGNGFNPNGIITEPSRLRLIVRKVYQKTK